MIVGSTVSALGLTWMMISFVQSLKGNCNQNLHLAFIDLIQSTTSITIDTQVLL